MSWERVASWSAGIIPGLVYENFKKKEKAKKESIAADEKAKAAEQAATTTATTAEQEAERKGRLALISTSPEGVFGTSTTGRNKVLGN